MEQYLLPEMAQQELRQRLPVLYTVQVAQEETSIRQHLQPEDRALQMEELVLWDQLLPTSIVVAEEQVAEMEALQQMQREQLAL
jgi:hypothetical protein